jgi:hypothetical protein
MTEMLSVQYDQTGFIFIYFDITKLKHLGNLKIS